MKKSGLVFVKTDEVASAWFEESKSIAVHSKNCSGLVAIELGQKNGIGMGEKVWNESMDG